MESQWELGFEMALQLSALQHLRWPSMLRESDQLTQVRLRRKSCKTYWCLVRSPLLTSGPWLPVAASRRVAVFTIKNITASISVRSSDEAVMLSYLSKLFEILLPCPFRIQLKRLARLSQLLVFPIQIYSLDDNKISRS